MDGCGRSEGCSEAIWQASSFRLQLGHVYMETEGRTEREANSSGLAEMVSWRRSGGGGGQVTGGQLTGETRPAGRRDGGGRACYPRGRSAMRPWWGRCECDMPGDAGRYNSIQCARAGGIRAKGMPRPASREAGCRSSLFQPRERAIAPSDWGGCKTRSAWIEAVQVGNWSFGHGVGGGWKTAGGRVGEHRTLDLGCLGAARQIQAAATELGRTITATAACQGWRSKASVDFPHTLPERRAIQSSSFPRQTRRGPRCRAARSI
jgi:hypothetical protein